MHPFSSFPWCVSFSQTKNAICLILLLLIMMGNSLSLANNGLENLPPYISSIPPFTFTVGRPVNFTMPAFVDPENGLMEYSITGLPPGFGFIQWDGRDGTEIRILRGTPSAPGNYTAVYTAKDNQGLTSSTSFTIEIISEQSIATIDDRLEKITCDYIQGWIWDRARPNTPLTIEFLSDNVVVGTTVADIFRQDLKTAGKGNGAHGYLFIVPTEVKNAQSHTIRARVAGTTHNLFYFPQVLTCPVGVKQYYEEYSDKVTCDFFRGWIWDKTRPDAPITVEFFADDVSLGTVSANIFRQDLQTNGKGNGVHGYNFITPSSLKDGRPHIIRARVPGTTYTLPWRGNTNNGKDLSCQVGVSQYFEEYTDKLNCDFFRGWIWDHTQPNTPITIEFLSDGVPIGSTVANIFRQDLLTLGRGNGEHGYNFITPASLKDGKSHRITARIPGRNYTLSWPPRNITCSSGARETAVDLGNKLPLKATILGNAENGQPTIEVEGAQGLPLTFQLHDLKGRLIRQWEVDNAAEIERQVLPTDNQAKGLLLLRVSTPGQFQTVRVLKIY